MIFMVFFLPLSLYFFYLSALNRAPRPKLVSGVWDTVGVLAALSGFLLIGGPSILSGLYEQWRMSWLLGSFQRLNEIRGTWSEWILLYAAYFVAVIVLTIWLVFEGRKRTSIYNIDGQVFEEILRRTLDECGLLWKRLGPHKLLLHGASEKPLDPAPLDREKEGAKLEMGPAATVDWRVFPAMCHASIGWRGVDREIREEVESRLIEQLRFVRSPANQAAAWFFTSGLILLMFSLLTLGFVIAIKLLRISA